MGSSQNIRSFEEDSRSYLTKRTGNSGRDPLFRSRPAKSDRLLGNQQQAQDEQRGQQPGRYDGTRVDARLGRVREALDALAACRT